MYVGTTSAILYRTILKIEKDAERFDFLARFRESQSSERRQHSRRMMKQGLMYSGALIVVIIMPLINFILYFCKLGPNYPAQLVLTIFYPIQGFFNMLIYLMPKGSTNSKSYSRSRRASSIEIPQHVLPAAKPERKNKSEENICTVTLKKDDDDVIEANVYLNEILNAE